MPVQANEPLPSGYDLNGYTIEKMLSSGGFSIVYLAKDPEGNTVAIKEYLPAGLALRSEGAIVKVSSDEHLAVFRHGLKCFFEEGRALALIGHANVVRVENFFRANDTCYMVMQYVRGRTLQFHIQRHRHEFSESFIRRIFVNLLNGLREVHANKLLHFDIKPANVYISMEGRPVLLDFGAARAALSEEGSKLKTMYTAGYAAPEQYAKSTGGIRSEIGPWTDIYSIGATMYTCIAGTPPQPADYRLKKDGVIPLKTLARQVFSEELYEIIEWCLKLDPLTRPQTAFELQKALMLEGSLTVLEGRNTNLLSTINKTLRTPISELFNRTAQQSTQQE
jgi:serine/threonine protein kinase